MRPAMCDHPRVRGRNIAIALLAAAGFVAIVRLTGPGTEMPGPPPAPAPSAAPPSPPPRAEATGPEATPAPGEISVRALLDEMIDLARLARLPSARFTAGQGASTDRRSRRP